MKLDRTMPNAFVPGNAALTKEEEALIERRQRALGPAYRLFYAHPLHIVRGEGVWLYDDKGEAYLDAYNNVASVGHCHPHVVAALSRQAALLCTNTRYLNRITVDYAEKLLAKFPAPLSHVMFTCSGSEANDLALRVAKAYTGGTGVIITEHAYHGITDSVAAMSPTLGRAVDLGAPVRTVPAPDLYRSGGGDVGQTFVRNIERAIDDMRRHGIKPAALIADTIFSSDGVFPDPPGFLKDAARAIRAAGGVFIADEVQPGFGRTGTHMWGFERHGVEPDMVSLGKPMGNGHPMSGLVMRPDVIAEFGRNARYFNTFGGNTVSCAVGLAVLEVIEAEGLLNNARDVGAYLRRGLEKLMARHEIVGDVRNAGLFLGVELVRDRESRAPDTESAARVVNAMRERRVLISATGPAANILKIRPPLVFSTANADLFVETLDGVLAAI
jgi:4-aminobutyrate aminotransferase-like enzyme